MSFIELTEAQVCDVVEFELRQQMIAYFYDYDLPDMDNVKQIYYVWRMFAPHIINLFYIIHVG